MTIAELIAEPLRTGMSRAGSPASRQASLTLASVRNGRLDLTVTKPIDLTTAEQAKYQVRPEAFYVVRGNGRLDLVGRGALSPRVIDEQVAFPDLLIEVIPDRSLIDPPYLAVVWNEAMVRSEIEGRARTSSGIHKINLANLRLVRLPIPSLAAQRRIVLEFESELRVATNIGRSVDEARIQARYLGDATRREFMTSLVGETAQIGSVVDRPGAIVDGPFGSSLKTDHYQTSGIRVIRLGNIGLGRFIDVDRAFVTQEHADHLRRHRAEPGDVAVAALGDGVRPAGRACLVPSNLGPSIVKADCFRVRTDGSRLDAAFLMHTLNSPQMLAIVERITRGATRPRMNLEMLKGLEVPIPTLTDQWRLVAELEERLAFIGTMEESLCTEGEAIEALPGALLRRAFEGLAA